MMRALPFSILFLFLFFGFQTPSSSLFEQAEEMFLNGPVKGDNSEWGKADSIFLSLYVEKGRLQPKEEILSVIYRISMRQSPGTYHADIEKQSEDLKWIEEILRDYPDLKNNETDLYVQLLNLKYRIELLQNQTGSLENLKKLAENYSGSKSVETSTISAVFETIAKHFHSQRNFPDALHYGNKSLNNLNSDWTFKRISMLQWVGGAYYNADKIDSSLYMMEVAYAELKNFPNETQSIFQRRSQLAFNIGMIFQGKTGDYPESGYYLKEAIDWEIKAHGEESPTLITYYSLLADTYFILKDIQKAEFYSLKAYSLANDVLKIESVYLKSLPSMSLSRVYVQQENYEGARKLMNQVLEESLDFFGKDDKFTTQVYIDLAFIEKEAGNFKEAEKYYLLAVDSSRATGRIYSISSAYDSLIDMYTETENYSEALYYAEQSEDLINKHLENDFKVKAISGLRLAKIYLGLNELNQAKNHLDRAEDILSLHHNTDLLDTEALSIRNSILFKEYQLTQNREALEKAFENIEELIEIIIKGKTEYNYQNSKLYYSQSVASYIENSMEIAAEMHKYSKESKVLNTLFRLMEINKSTVLLDGMMDLEIKTEKGVSNEILNDEKRLNRELSQLNDAIYLAQSDSTTTNANLQNMLDKQIELNYEIEKIQEYLRENHPDYYEAKNLLLAENIRYYQQKALKKNQAFLEYFVGKDKVYRLYFSKSKVQFDELNNSNDIQISTLQLVENLLERKEIKSLSKDLASELLPDFEDNIEDLIVIADKELNQIPFEILEDETGILLEKMNLSYAGSVQLYNAQKQMSKQKRSSGKWMGFAPVYEGNPLPNNQNEVQKIKDLTDGIEVLGEMATKSKFLEEAPDALVLHLATHSEIDKNNPMLSKMYFTAAEDSGELTASEVYNLDLNADLVVLSACSTGLGKNESGDGVMSMARAFTYAGVSSAVMSLWQVSDRQTSELMVKFYENLKKGQDKNEALRNAKLEYLASVQEPELQHPYYWAGFVISGDITPISEKSYTWLYVFGILLVSGMIFTFLKFRASRAIR